MLLALAAAAALAAAPPLKPPPTTATTATAHDDTERTVAAAATVIPATQVPLPLIVCARLVTGPVVFHSFHADYETARAAVEDAIAHGLETTTPAPTVSHRIPASQVREVMLWDWREGGDAPACPQSLPPLKPRVVQ